MAGASSHPGKFGFVALHNILANGYAGPDLRHQPRGHPGAGHRHGGHRSRRCPTAPPTWCSCAPPPPTNPDLLRAAAAKGITAAFLASAGYGEAGEEGRRAQDELVALADELGVLMVGPNGQGVVSTPSSLCAQIVAPYPPAGPHRGGQPVGQLRVVVHELRLRQRRRDQPGGVGRQLGHGGRHRLPGLLRRRPGHRRGPGLRGGHPRRPAVLRGDPGGGRAAPGGAGQGRRHLGRASGPRPATPARWPPTTGSSTGCAARPA